MYLDSSSGSITLYVFAGVSATGTQSGGAGGSGHKHGRFGSNPLRGFGPEPTQPHFGALSGLASPTLGSPGPRAPCRLSAEAAAAWRRCRREDTAAAGQPLPRGAARKRRRRCGHRSVSPSDVRQLREFFPQLSEADAAAALARANLNGNVRVAAAQLASPGNRTARDRSSGSGHHQ